MQTRISSKCGLLAAAGVSLLALCFSGCGAVSSSSPTTTSAGISISMSTAPPTTIAAGGTATIAATVSGDSANGGVDWSCAPSGSCGSFSQTHTTSGGTTTYTAPAGGSVTITATSSSDHGKVATAPVTVSGSGTLSMAFATAPPATLTPGGTAVMSATVSNDTALGGVDWTCSPTGSCGSFNPAHTPSGGSTTFTAPSTTGTVTITAASTTNSSITTSGNISVSTTTTAAGTLSAGSFSFTATGVNSKKITYAVAGSVALDSSGNVTGGIQDYNSHDGPASQTGGDKITGGKLTTAANGKGTLTVITGNTAEGVGGTETFSVAVVNSKHAVIGEFDGSASSSGSMDLQTLPSAGLASLKGPFTFVVSGQASGVLEIFGGNVTPDGAGNVRIKINQNKGGVVTSGSNSGSYAAPDPLTGRGTMSFGGDDFSYYVVNPKVFRLIVIDEDNTDIGAAYAGVTGVSNATLNTQFVFTDSSDLAPGALFAAAGLIKADGNGGVSGFADVNENGHATKAPFTGTYAIDSNGFGSITITPGNLQDIGTLGLYLVDPSINFSDPNSPADAGLSGLLIDLDSKLPGSGVLILPGKNITAPAGKFALSVQTSNTNNEADAVGVVTIAPGGALTGTEDIDDLFNTISTTAQNSAVAISGTVTLDLANPGRFTLPLVVNVGATPRTLNFAAYPASNTQIIVLETDSPQYGLGMLQQQQ